MRKEEGEKSKVNKRLLKICRHFIKIKKVADLSFTFLAHPVVSSLLLGR